MARRPARLGAAVCAGILAWVMFAVAPSNAETPSLEDLVPSSAAVTLTPVGPAAPGEAGTLDLTALGDLDWIHLIGMPQDLNDVPQPPDYYGHAVTKAGSPGLIAVDTLASGSIADTEYFVDSPMTTLWSDGPADGRKADLTTEGAAFTATHGGYKLTVDPGPTTRKLLMVTGAWGARATLTVRAGGTAQTLNDVFTSERFGVNECGPDSSEAAQASPNTSVVEVVIAPNRRVEVTAEVVQACTTPRGNVSLIAAALGSVGGHAWDTLTVAASDGFLNSPGAPESQPIPVFNLPAIGQRDWYYKVWDIPGGRAVGGDADVIVGPEYLQPDCNATPPGDRQEEAQSRPMPWRYAWGPGPAQGSFAEIRQEALCGGSFQPGAGFTFSVASAPTPQTIVFDAGAWQASYTLTATAIPGGQSKTLTEVRNLAAGAGPSGHKVYVVRAPAGTGVQITLTHAASHHEFASFVVLGGIAVYATPAAFSTYAGADGPGLPAQEPFAVSGCGEVVARLTDPADPDYVALQDQVANASLEHQTALRAELGWLDALDEQPNPSADAETYYRCRLVMAVLADVAAAGREGGYGDGQTMVSVEGQAVEVSGDVDVDCETADTPGAYVQCVTASGSALPAEPDDPALPPSASYGSDVYVTRTITNTGYFGVLHGVTVSQSVTLPDDTVVPLGSDPFTCVVDGGDLPGPITPGLADDAGFDIPHGATATCVAKVPWRVDGDDGVPLGTVVWP